MYTYLYMYKYHLSIDQWQPVPGSCETLVAGRQHDREQHSGACEAAVAPLPRRAGPGWTGGPSPGHRVLPAFPSAASQEINQTDRTGPAGQPLNHCPALNFFLRVAGSLALEHLSTH